MGRFIIVSKDRPGNVPRTTCNVKYQVRKCGNKIFTTELYCMGDYMGEKNKYCWLADSPREHIITDEETNDFLKEFKEFQKGGSYRRKNPIKE